MNHKRTLAGIIIALILALCFIPVRLSSPASAAKSKEKEKTVRLKTGQGEMVFRIQDQEAVISSYQGEDEILEIPAFAGGYPVAALDENAVFSFHASGTLKCFRPASGHPAFTAKDGVLFSADGKKLLVYPGKKGTKYTVPDTTEEIGPGAFANLPVEEVVFPDSLSKIGRKSFYNCYKMALPDLPENLTRLEEGAFDGLTFAGMKGERKTLKLGPKLAHIGKYAFRGLQFGAFEVDEGNTCYASENGLLMSKTKELVLECPKMIGSRVVIPEGAKELNPGVFAALSASTVFVLPDSLVTMRREDFPAGEDLTLVVGPGSAAESFALEHGIQTAEPDSDMQGEGAGYDKSLYTLNGVCHLKVYNHHAVFLSYQGKDRTVYIPESADGKPVTEIGDGHNEIKQLQTFSMFSALGFGAGTDSVTYDDNGSLTERERQKDRYVTEEFIMPATVKRINKNAFSFVQSETPDDWFELPAGLEYISPLAFGDFSGNKISGWSISKDNKHFCCVQGVLFTKDKSTLVLFPAKISPESKMIREEETEQGTEYRYKIPEGTKTIGKYAFFSMNHMDVDKNLQVLFPKSLRTIENNAFQKAFLNEIRLNEGLTTVGKEAFAYAAVMSSRLDLPDSIREIGDKAFTGMNTGGSQSDRLYGFSHIELPEMLESVGANAFSSEEYRMQNQAEILSLDEIRIKKNLAKADGRSFRGLDARNFTADSDNQVFASKEGLLTDKEGRALLAVPNGRAGHLRIPDGIVSVEADAFGGCRNITQVEFPDSVRFISEDAFRKTDIRPVFLCGKASAADAFARKYHFKRKERRDGP